MEQRSLRGETDRDFVSILNLFYPLRQLLPTVLGMASDSVANVRFNVAKTLQQISTVVPAAALQSQVRPCIEKLNNDSDFDVRYYASEAAMGRTGRYY